MANESLTSQQQEALQYIYIYSKEKKFTLVISDWITLEDVVPLKN